MKAYCADKRVLRPEATPWEIQFLGDAVWQPACRCYRCGVLLTVDSVTVDRIIPGCLGGTYRRNNIRPACSMCNSSTGGKLARRKK